MKPLYDAAAAAKAATRLSSWYNTTQYGRIGSRVQIIDPRLCHDVLQRLAPSLERHKGCDLIDFFPGVCLWSEHLHEILQPRRHILVEPNRAAFEPYLKSLLDRNPERFQWTDKHLSQVFEDDTFFGESKILDDSTRFTTGNPKILVNINLAGAVESKHNFSARRDAYFFNNLYASLFGLRDDLYKRGLFRVLAWVPDDFKHHVVPRNVDRRSRQALEFEVCTTITEVAGASREMDQQSRSRRIVELENEDMEPPGANESLGLVVPDGRTDVPPIPPAVHLHPSVESLRSGKHVHRHDYLDRLLELDEQVKALHPEVYEKLKWAWASLGQRPPVRSRDPIVREWLSLYNRARTLHLSHLNKLRIVGEQRSIESEWRVAAEAGRTKMPVSLHRQAEQIKATMDGLRKQDGVFCRRAIDDFRAFDMRALSWYRRPYNPLIVRPDEFAQQKPLALMDVQPDPNFRKLFADDIQWRTFDYVITRLSNGSQKNMLSVLSHLVPGGVDEFIETVPILKDIRKGGWYDMSELRARSLPTEVWVQIAQAYYNWPFRLSSEQLWKEGLKSRKVGEFAA